ncbi:putative F-box protein At4g22660 [Dendrobium catenatum]|uniref:F-box protein n=1 Tax=Dendrobium catenatum TaxID=906689 RepID=A0A2I0V905_9ASPA|nr:putative F-box protein At4g22660 [Dendrobium catenatum]PKU59898.1 Putative F-box protein [Dendrobium catenatum]
MAWSDLPIDLLHCLSSHFPIVDYLRFAATCTSWNFALAKNDLFRIQRTPSPWLLLPNNAGEASDTLTFCDLTTKKEEGGIGCNRCFSCIGNHISGRRCYGSKDGWLVTLDLTYLQPCLFNPLTKAEISLPSLFTIPEDQRQRIKPEYDLDGHIKYYYDEKHPSYVIDAESFRDLYFQKIAISSSDPFGTIVVIYGFIKLLALARPGDHAWVLGPQLPPYHVDQFEEFEDVYFHEEEQMFYAITHFSAVLAFDLEGKNVKFVCQAIQDPYSTDSYCRNYIAFLSGTLLKIKREISGMEVDERYTKKTTKISVFKFVPAINASSCSSSQWISMTDLGDFSLFIGYNQTISLHHTVALGIRPNCIYFADHADIMTQDDATRDAGLYDLHNDCFQYFLDSNSQPNWPPSIWFTPSL